MDKHMICKWIKNKMFVSIVHRANKMETIVNASHWRNGWIYYDTITPQNIMQSLDVI